MTCSIILPWLRLRKVSVRAEVLSNHCVRLHFDYVNTHPGHFVRISHNPLFEWHSFATISVPGTNGYSAVVSRAGDWTSKEIAEPPKEIWVRGIPCYGVVAVTPLFRRVVLVATGSGIGPIAPVVYAKKVPLQLLWTAPAVRKTFGDALVDSLLEANPNALIYGQSTPCCCSGPRCSASMQQVLTDLLVLHRHAGAWKTGHGQADVSPSTGVQRRSCCYYIERAAHAQSRVWYDE